MAGDVLLGTVGLVALLAPGWMVARALGINSPLLAGFILSVVVLEVIIVTFAIFNVPLRPMTVGSAWALFGLISAVYFRRTSCHRTDAPTPVQISWPPDWPILLPLFPMLAVVTYRACAQPLFGIDTVFRWNYLAEQMLLRETLAFYPPVTSGDYEIYSWPDGIPPVVSSLYFWLYCFARASKPALTAPTIIFQFLLVSGAAFAVGQRFFGKRAGMFAAALVACSPMIAWATTMGQETGLTALSVAGLLLYLPGSRAEEKRSLVVLAALAASMGGLAREYGLVFPALGFVLCLIRKLSRQAVLTFLSVTLLATAPWYVRNWILTGNPLFNLSIGTLFPVNEVHRALNDAFRDQLGWSNLPPGALRLLVTNCLSGLAGILAGAVLFRRRTETRMLLLASGVVVAVWATSLGYTAAGFFYSLRVLNPALILASVLGGAALAYWVPAEQFRNVAILAMLLVAMDASVRFLTLPANVYRIPIAQWLDVGGALHDYHARPVYRDLAGKSGDERMLVLGPNALLSKHGARTVPLWSPEVRFIYEPNLPAVDIARKLREANIGFVLINRTGVNQPFLARSALFRNPAGALLPIWGDEDMVLFRLHSP